MNNSIKSRQRSLIVKKRSRSQGRAYLMKKNLNMNPNKFKLIKLRIIKLLVNLSLEL